MQDANRSSSVPPQYSNLRNFLNDATKAGVKLSVTVCDSPGSTTSTTLTQSATVAASKVLHTRTRTITPPLKFKISPQKPSDSQSSVNSTKKRKEPSDADVQALLELSKKAWKEHEQQHASTTQARIPDGSNTNVVIIPQSLTQAVLASEPQQGIAHR